MAPPIHASVALDVFYALYNATGDPGPGLQLLIDVWPYLYAWHAWIMRNRMLDTVGTADAGTLLLLSPMESAEPGRLAWRHLLLESGRNDTGAYINGTACLLPDFNFTIPQAPQQLQQSPAWQGQAMHVATWCALGCLARCGYNASCAAAAGCPFAAASALDTALFARASADLATIAAWLQADVVPPNGDNGGDLPPTGGVVTPQQARTKSISTESFSAILLLFLCRTTTSYIGRPLQRQG
jgi:hypothetical protein